MASKKRRFTLRMESGLYDRLYNAAYWLPGRTASGITEQALNRFLAELELKNGGPFKQRPEGAQEGGEKEAGESFTVAPIPFPPEAPAPVSGKGRAKKK